MANCAQARTDRARNRRQRSADRRPGPGARLRHCQRQRTGVLPDERSPGRELAAGLICPKAPQAAIGAELVRLVARQRLVQRVGRNNVGSLSLDGSPKTGSGAGSAVPGRIEIICRRLWMALLWVRGCSPVRLDHVRGLLGDHDHGRVGVARSDGRRRSRAGPRSRARATERRPRPPEDGLRGGSHGAEPPLVRDTSAGAGYDTEGSRSFWTIAV
jgi:hypothetical protein